eukprot:CAMPEP_0206470472 /NCGR_PEP_ID=MMETSP0324_2-20121206/30952_1 /ASSEMBLY_ACC=CAM_ASM_000836 /TAXON_ID=2866 /ORGANISM="Crypthecodinium cohnii, Strain Seligo" /LENGTH=32 /DNA_ID= /DNA_START= /DNA_END= /DNA_ORIENTATION=
MSPSIPNFTRYAVRRPATAVPNMMYIAAPKDQ